jgi:putative ABC transport system substrate-binding protein
MDRRTFLATAAGGLLANPPIATAQQPERVYRLGVLSPIFVRGRHEMLELVLRDLSSRGFIEGKNLLVEHRSAVGEFELLPQLATELARLKMDVIMAEAAVGTRAAQHATQTIPIVMICGDDPVRAGFVASLAKPAGNITGVALLMADLAVKRLELLKMAVPRAHRVAVLLNPTNQTMMERLGEVQAVAASQHIQLVVVELRGPEELEGALARVSGARPDALLMFADPIFFRYRQRIGDFAGKSRLPMVSDWRQMAEAGALVTYGPSFKAVAKRVAIYIDRILKGASPADLPVEQPTEVDLVINLKTAKALGLTIPPSLLQRADQVIE